MISSIGRRYGQNALSRARDFTATDSDSYRSVTQKSYMDRYGLAGEVMDYDNPFRRCEAIIRNGAARLLKAGGGPLSNGGGVRQFACGTNKFGKRDAVQTRAEIIAEWRKTGKTQQALADKFKVSQAFVGKAMILAGIRLGKGARGFRGLGNISTEHQHHAAAR